MSNAPHQTIVVHHQQEPGTSGLAIAGLVFSILGWFTCGLLCIPGALFSFFGLFARGPKGAAIAGLIVGFPGVAFFIFMGLGIIMAFLGIGAAATNVAAEAERQRAEAETSAHQATDKDEETNSSPKLPAASDVAENQEDPTSEIPLGGSTDSVVLPPPTIPEEPVDPVAAEDPAEQAKWRTWTTADRQHTIEAKFIKFSNGQVTLEKKDGSTVDVKLDILCSEDQDFIKQRKWTRPGPEK